MIGWLVLPACFTAAAPELSDADRQRLVDGTTDNDAQLDQQDGLYVLLRNASSWQGDDFSGDAGAAVAPPPDYDFIKDKPGQARGNVYLIEGWLAQHDRFPTNDNHDRDQLVRAGDPAWGDQVTRWTIATAKGDPDSTIIVLFNDPRAQMADPGKQAIIKVAARFYKLWTIPSANGKPFTYAVFVGGAAEEVQASAASGGGMSMGTIVLAVVAAVGAFFILRIVLNRMNNGGRQRTSELLAARRRERELLEDEEEIDEDLPEDPIEALDVLSKRHGENVE